MANSLSPQAQQVIAQTAAQSSLEYVYPRVYTSPSNIPGGQTSFSHQLRKAVSQATAVTMIIQPTAATQDAAADSMLSEANAYSRWQVRVGSQLHPAEVVEGTQAGAQSFFMAQSVWNVDSPHHVGSADLTDYETDRAIVAVKLARSDKLALSGVAINNSRSLEVNGQLTAATSAPRSSILFLQYLAIASVFIDNVATSI